MLQLKAFFESDTVSEFLAIGFKESTAALNCGFCEDSIGFILTANLIAALPSRK